MKVTFKNPGFYYSIDSILLFQTEGEAPFWSDSLLYFYPQIDKEILLSKDFNGKKQYITGSLEKVYAGILPELKNKVGKYNDYFLEYQSQINNAFSDAFMPALKVFAIFCQ